MLRFIKKHIMLFLLILSILIINALIHLINDLNTFEIIFQLTSVSFFIAVAIFYIYKFDNMKQQAFTCQLTGVYNRKKFFDILNDEIQRSDRMGTQLSAIFFDIDNFTDINTRLGHYTGDQILVALSATVKDTLRSYDSLARVGGEEFAIIMPDTGIDEAYIISERVRIAARNLRINKNVDLTISVGVAEYDTGDTSDDIYKKIDDAMFVSKNAGKNRTTIWNDSIEK